MGTSRNPGVRPSQSELSNFLGMPAPATGGRAPTRNFGASSTGLRESSPLLTNGNRHSNVWQGDHFTIGTVGGAGSVTTPGGITVGGAGGAVAIKGPGGNTVVRGGGAIGGTDGVNSVGRVGGFAGVQGSAGNRAVAGRGATFHNGQFVGGDTWSAVNGNFNHWNSFYPSWYAGYPGAWYPGRWAAASAWTAATWATLAGWWGYGSEPIYYDYGGDVGYSDGQIYYGDEPVATEQQYYNEASDIAAMGNQATDADEEWLPLGVFGLVVEGQSNTDKIFQLAVNKTGLIRGNYQDVLSNQVFALEGAVDGQTQRAAWHVREKPETVMETGVYNLTNDEVPILVHFGPNKTEQRMLVRLDNPENSTNGSPGSSSPQ